MSATRRHAFSLVELLVVIAIVVLLVALLLPALRRVRGQALNVQCKSNFQQIAHAIQMYVNNHRNRFPDPVSLPRIDFPPNGYSHTLHADFSIGTYVWFKFMDNNAAHGPERVE
jgi:prepilin-type N-terminal cleavage/methylation domain-containing protein